MDINTCIAYQVRQRRHEQGFSLDALAQRSGVSRSNISLIERGQSSPTAAVLDKLATALRVAVASLFEGPASPLLGPGRVPAAAPLPVSRVAAQALWADPASGYLRRNVSPPGVGSPIQLVDVIFPAGQRVVFDTAERDAHIHQQVWMIEGRMDITVGATPWRLQAGDCLALRLDCPVSYRNPTRHAARYLVALATLPYNAARASR